MNSSGRTSYALIRSHNKADVRWLGEGFGKDFAINTAGPAALLTFNHSSHETCTVSYRERLASWFSCISTAHTLPRTHRYAADYQPSVP